MGTQQQAGWQYGLEFLADAPIACHEVDLNGRIVRVNGAECRLLSMAELEILGRAIWDFVAPEEQSRVRESCMRTLGGAEPPEFLERTWFRPDGARLLLEIHSIHLHDAKGEIVGLRSFLFNITRRIEAEEALRKTQESLENRIKERTVELELANEFLRRELEERQRREEEHRRLQAQVQHAQRLESLGVLAGGIAHDFNNLLASIMGYASLATMDLPDESRARKSLEQVLAAARSASDLTQQMLAYSGRGTFVVDLLNVTQLIESVTRLLETTISKKATLRLHLAPELPPVQGDASQIRQVVMNLITNASESLGENRGEVRVTARRREPDSAGGNEPDYQCFRIARRESGGGSGHDRGPMGGSRRARCVGAGKNFAGGPLRVHRSGRYRRRYGCGDAGAHLRSVFHDQIHGPRPGAGRRAGHHSRPSRKHSRQQPTRRRDHVPSDVSRRGRVGFD
jgi:PAS domain S-box-containing protein